MKWQFNKKNTTYAVYACGVILFAVLCIGFLVNRDSYTGFFRKILIDVIAPIFFGVIIAYLLNPILRISEKIFDRIFKGKCGKKGLRALGLVSTYVVFLGAITGFMFILIPQISHSMNDLVNMIVSLVNDLPLYLQNLIDSNESFAGFYDMLVTNVDLPGLLNTVQGSLGNVITGTFGIVQSVFNVVVALILGLFFSIYFLASKELLVSQIKRFFLAFFSFRHNVTLGHFVTTVDVKFGQFIRGKILDSFIVMVIVYILTWIFGIPYYPMIALIIGVTDLIPVFGPFLGAIPSAMIILISPDGGFRAALIFAAIILVVQQLDGNLLAPLILGDRVGISGVWIMIAVVVMGGLFGVLGMFFGVPVFAVIYSLVGEAIHKKLVKKGLAEQMEDEDETPPEKKRFFRRIKDRMEKREEEAAKTVAETPSGEVDEEDLLK